jgi:hypothetical protein
MPRRWCGEHSVELEYRSDFAASADGRRITATSRAGARCSVQVRVRFVLARVRRVGAPNGRIRVDRRSTQTEVEVAQRCRSG